MTSAKPYAKKMIVARWIVYENFKLVHRLFSKFSEMIQLQLSQKNREIIFVLLLFVIPFLSPGLALLLGLIVALTMGNPFIQHNKVFSKMLVEASVVG